MSEDPLEALLVAGTSGRPHPLFPGAVLGLDVAGHRRTLAVGDAVAYADAAGTTPLPADQRVPVAADTLYDLASLTKLVTATLVVGLVDRGELRLEDPVQHHLPAFRGGGREAVTVAQLLTHTSGLPADTLLWRDHPDPVSRRAAVLAEPLEAAPGAVYRYSCVGYLLLGLVLERLAGPLPELVSRELAEPLGLPDLRFRPRTGSSVVAADRIAATEVRPVSWSPLADPDVLDTRGVVHDEKAASWDGIAGNAGLFGTAADLLGLGRALLDRLAGRPSGFPLSGRAARMLVTPAVPVVATPGFEMALGWRVDDRGLCPALAGRRQAYSHTGFTGTSLVVDEARDLVLVLLTNRVHPSRTWSDLGPFRRSVADAVARAVGPVA